MVLLFFSLRDDHGFVVFLLELIMVSFFLS